MEGLYLHVKTNKIYDVLRTDVLDATNGQDGKIMVAYISPSTGQLFVREYNEFFDGRFKRIEEDE